MQKIGRSSEDRQNDKKANFFASTIGQFLVSIVVLAITFLFLGKGFVFLRDSVPETTASKAVVSAVAIVWGVGGVAMLYFVSNWLMEKMSSIWSQRLEPVLFVGPAVLMLTWYLALPMVRTFWISLFGADGPPDNLPSLKLLFTSSNEYWAAISEAFRTTFVGFGNYYDVFFNERIMAIAVRNNVLWIVFGATLSVIFGLLIAILADRSRFESFAKSLIFLPMAISMVGAGVIWNFVYEVKDAADPQIGLLNAIWVGLGNEPQAWTVLLQPWNNLFLIVIVIWLQTGFAMVLFSAAIKGVPSDLLEAARVDGATEVQTFFRIIIPCIRGTIVAVSTTIIIFTLKIFDVVMVMTGGQFGTHVIATQFYRQNFTNRNYGYGSAIAVVLLIAVIPVMIYNLKQFGERKAFQ